MMPEYNDNAQWAEYEHRQEWNDKYYELDEQAGDALISAGFGRLAEDICDTQVWKNHIERMTNEFFEAQQRRKDEDF